MNIDRIIRFASWFLFFTGFHIYWYDHQKLRYRLAVVGTFYYLVLFVLYLISFCHHYENSELLKTVKDFLPFLYHLIRFQVVVGLVVVINQILESKKLANISNSLIEIFAEDIKSVKKNVDIFEVLVYFMLFGTFLVAITIGLYVAIEVQFALPPLDHIMLCMALFMPHFTLAGCLRLYSLCLWLTKRELDNLRMNFQAVEQNGFPRCSVALEIIIPVVNITDNNEIYRKVSLRLNTLAEFFKLFDPVIQRQLTLLMGLNFNCLLAGVYGYVNYANTWKVLFTARNQRIFHAVNGGIFLCILMDYGILLFSNLSFIEVKRQLYNLIEEQLIGNNHHGLEMQRILQIILYKLSKKLKCKLFCLVQFKIWNFIVLQSVLSLIIAVVISHKFLQDQIIQLNEDIDVYNAN